MKLKNRHLLFASLALLGFALNTQVSVAALYDLSTADSSGAGQNTFAASADAGGAGGTFGGTLPGNLTFTSGTVANTSDYFVGTFSSQSLRSVGDTLTLSFSVTLSNVQTTGSQHFRFGLFDVGTATTGASSTFNAATGYRADYGNNNNANNGIRQRTGTNANLFAGAATPIFPDQTSAGFTCAPINGTYTGSLTLELLTDGHVKITSTFANQAPQSVTDSIDAFTNFNAFGFFVADTSTTQASLNFTALSVNYTAIPEPGITAAAIALATLGIASCIRRRATR
ncbi:cell wall anchor protein [Opitutaceae bacterium TAV4]|nr:cell wall anchor protein [Opitutaceae bacterium TAV4]RRJ97299.1 cell wall anchor protein [Opitutaceae bacterium TAV4]RRJ98922.1 cell wall anchor protein [Opitutaceae bacterium TAV3]